MFDKNSLMRLMYSLLVAAISTMIILAMTDEYNKAIILIVKGMLVGEVIWLLSEALFALCERHYPKSIIHEYVVLVLLLLVGSVGFGVVLGVDTVGSLFKMIMAAELCGVGITLLYRRRYTKDLNEKLSKIKKEL